MSQVVEHCDRAIYLHKGRIVADGDPEQVVGLYQAATMTEHSELLNAVS